MIRTTMKRTTLFLLSLFLITGVQAQKMQLDAAEIRQELKKLNTVGSVLYLAAHPDDENTSVIGYMVNEKHLRTGYLSLTRGDGGQNLIGPEKGPLLGVLRTQELLEARKVDGGEQYFSRAIDFGYSKTAEETFNIWNKERILSDVVRVIRKFRPDIIITRFPSNGYKGGHGHHTGSAILADEAFQMAGDPEAFPEQLKTLEPWQPKRLLFNTSTWWDKELPEKAPKDDELVETDLGGYNFLLGKSYTQIAAESRSMHKCQGFGVSRRRGEDFEYFRYLKGKEFDGEALLGGLDLSWSRLEGGEAIGQKVQKVLDEYDLDDPSRIVPGLVELHQAVMKLDDEHWKQYKLGQIEQLILACTGTQLEATAARESASPGDEVEITAQAVNGSNFPLELKQVNIAGDLTNLDSILPYERYVKHTAKVTLPANLPYTTPYWLQKPPRKGTYHIPKKHTSLIGEAQAPPKVGATFTLEADGHPFSVSIPVEYEWTSEVEGEIREPFSLVPEVTCSFDSKVYVFARAEPQEVTVNFRGWKDSLRGELSLEVPENWSVQPSSAGFQLDRAGAAESITFTVTPPENTAQGTVKPVVKVGDKRLSHALDKVNYPHIDEQTIVRQAGADLVRRNIRTRGKSIGYIMGSGDEVPQALRQMGYEVTELDPGKLQAEALQKFDAVIVGVRGFNVNEVLAHKNEELFEYAKQGGHVVVQYNKDEEDLVTQEVAPYSLRIAYDRVTVETAPATLLDEEHPLLNSPNPIGQEDFEGWVQERGLYFPDQWDDAFTPLISWHDPGEKPKKGGLLVAEHGKGSYIYTGIAFFRQLPAGVPGAFELFANIVSYGIDEKP